jgi:hypothetical protein
MVKFVLNSMQGIANNNNSHMVPLFAMKSFDNCGGCNGQVSIEVLTNQDGDNQNFNDLSNHDNIEEDDIVLDDDDE